MKPIPTSIDLPIETRTAIVQLCNARLADTVDLRTQLKQAHWNVKGPHFVALHDLFDRIEEDVEEYLDLIAERAVQLGGKAHGTARVAARASHLPEYPLDAERGRDHLQALTKALATHAQLVRTAIDTADELGDKNAADLFTEVSRGIDRWLWQVEAHLQADA